MAYEWMTGIGTLLGGIAAAYAAIVGVQTYRDGLSVRLVESLFELEGAFKSTFPLMAALEDDAAYSARVKPVLQKALSKSAFAAEELETIEKVDLAMRFFYLLWVRTKLLKAEAPLVNVYLYYFRAITDATTRPDLREYVSRYYTPLIPWFQS